MIGEGHNLTHNSFVFKTFLFSSPLCPLSAPWKNGPPLLLCPHWILYKDHQRTQNLAFGLCTGFSHLLHCEFLRESALPLCVLGVQNNDKCPIGAQCLLDKWVTESL